MTEEHSPATTESEVPQRLCPRDRSALKRVILDGVPIDRCARCGGAWLDHGDVHELQPGLDLVPSDSHRLLHPVPLRSCPACAEVSLERNVYESGGKRVRLWRCLNCSGVWFESSRVPKASSVEGPAHAASGSETLSDGRSGVAVDLPRRARDWFVAITGVPIDVGNPCRIFPVATVGIIAAAIMTFVLQCYSDEWTFDLALIPDQLAWSTSYRLLTSVFLHVGIAHLLVNVLFLYIFGDNVEERFGFTRYLLLFFTSGAVAGLASVVEGGEVTASVARVGASGAISGVMGAYLVVFPHARILMAVPVIRFAPFVFRAPVWVFVAVWVALNLYGFYQQRDGAALFTVDYVAHLVGLAFGVGAAWWLLAFERGPGPAEPSASS